MLKKIFVTGLIFSSLASFAPVLAQTSTEDRFVEKEKRLEERFQEAKNKLQEKINSFKNKKATSAAVTQCVAAAVNVRETAIGSAFTTYAGAQSAALSARALALNAAWSVPSSTPSSTVKSLRLAVQTAWKAYNNPHRSVVRTHNTATKNAWSSFKVASKACMIESSAGRDLPRESAGEGQDMTR
ncbi:MAG: hypothetical protein AAB467_05105 [Patescibacteria group bacterium]